MGRKIPSSNNASSQAFHQTLPVPVLLVGIAAVMAMVSFLCGVRRKPESSPSTPKSAEKNTNSPLISPQTEIETRDVVEQTEGAAVIEIAESDSGSGSYNESQRNLFGPKKTAGKQLMKDAFSSTNLMKKSASTRILAKNLSTKMHRSMSMAGRDFQERINKGGKFKPEESVWMKTIILGEKCRVEDGEEAIIYERKGNKISAYHPKTSNTLIHHKAIRFQDGESTHFSD